MDTGNREEHKSMINDNANAVARPEAGTDVRKIKPCVSLHGHALEDCKDKLEVSKLDR